MIPALGILVARRMEQPQPGPQSRGFWRTLWPILPAGAISLLLVKADYNQADVGRTAAKELHAKHQNPGRKIWFQGHWGFQYYMEQFGAAEMDINFPKMAAGEMIILPALDNNNAIYDLPSASLRLIEAREYLPTAHCTTMSISSGAGFYAAIWGPLPFAFGQSIRPERFYAFQLTRPFASASDLAADLSQSGALIQQWFQEKKIVQYRAKLRTDPNNAEAHFQLGLFLCSRSKPSEAREHFNQILQMSPEDGPAHLQLALLAKNRQESTEAIKHYRAALHSMPDSIPAMNGLTWILSTAPDAQLRNGAEAVKLAESANELSSHNSSLVLGTLAAAYAEAGRFAEAVASAGKAIDLAQAAGDQESAATNRKLLDLYLAKQPYREPIPMPLDGLTNSGR